MTARIPKDPSPIKAGFTHGALSLTALCAIFGTAGGIIHLTGNADAGSPRVEIALFDENGEVAPTLKTRLPGDDASRELMIASLNVDGIREPVTEPSLGVEYGQPQRRTVSTAPTQMKAEPPQAETGIRINGKLVAPGQSLSQVGRETETDDTRKTIQVPSATQTAPAQVQTVASVQSRPDTPFEKYAKPFENPDGKPTVSIIVGGMGVHWRPTQAAIRDLPAEVTLSFAPGTKDLSTWIRRARADGHEVLIEVPMEPYSYGRTRPHPQVLQSGVEASVNQQRLDRLLSRVRGYTGVINYQGAKFATSESGAKLVTETLNDRGIAFFEDGSLTDSAFAAAAGENSVTYAKAESVIDALPEGDPIEVQLMYLETQAKENGAALGTAFAYPISIDMITEWTKSLEAKGIVLAPASHYARQREKPQTVTVQSSGQPLQPAP